MNVKYQRPRKFEIEQLTPTYGKFIAEPFERGYGTTIGSVSRIAITMTGSVG